jgi:hypothetical protein
MESRWSYLESALSERSLEVVRLAGQHDLVDIDLVRSADQFAVRMLLRRESPGGEVSFIDNEQALLTGLTSQSPFSGRRFVLHSFWPLSMSARNGVTIERTHEMVKVLLMSRRR